MELRGKVRRLIREDDYCDGPDEAVDALADAILAIPEIAEALKARQPIYVLGEMTEETRNWPGKPDGVRKIKPPNA